MHVVQVLAALSVGGSEYVVAELSEHLRERGDRVTVIGRDGPLAARIHACGAELLDWPIGRKRLGTLKLVRRLADWISENQPDIVHVHSRLPAWICHLALRRLDRDARPVFITSMHGQYSVSAYSAVMARGDHVIAVSDHIRSFSLEHYAFLEEDKISTIHGGISRQAFPRGHHPDPAWFAGTLAEFPELESKRILLLPGRLSRYKGHAMFLELIASIREHHPDVHGVVLGQTRPGSRYQAELEGLAQRERVTANVSFVGLRHDIRDWMSAADIVYNLCSDPPEAFGRVVPEALHLGVPVLAWDHGGVREVLAEMFPQGAVRPNRFPDLLEKTRQFLEQPPEVPASSAFGLAESMQKTVALYHRLT
jgi:glycosyltransferase involved in cell wall biosynthesis